MADLDPNVQALLSVLDDTPAGALADIVRERIRDIDERPEGMVIRSGRRARDQLKFANEVINGFVTRELAMMERLQTAAGKFEIKAIKVMPPNEAGRPDDLISAERRRVLQSFQSDWGTLYESVLDTIEDRDGPQG